MQLGGWCISTCTKAGPAPVVTPPAGPRPAADRSCVCMLVALQLIAVVSAC